MFVPFPAGEVNSKITRMFPQLWWLWKTGKKEQIWPISWLNFVFFPPNSEDQKITNSRALVIFSKKTGENHWVKNWGKNPVNTAGPEGQRLERRWLVAFAPRRRGALRWEDLEGLGAQFGSREIAGDDSPNVRGWWWFDVVKFEMSRVQIYGCFDAYGNYLSIELWKSMSD